MKSTHILSTCFIGLVTIVFLSSYSTHSINEHNTITSDTTDNDTIWNVIVYIEFSVDSNGKIHDVAAEQPFECYRCDSTMITDLKKEAIETVEAMPKWENYQHKDIRYEIPIHMVRTHPHHTHHVHHHIDSVRVDTD